MTSANDAAALRRRLRAIGLSAAAIAAAWPRWWTQAADRSTSARAELAFTLARRFGLDPRSLFGTGEPRFLWRDEARFKHLAAATDLERASLTSFGRAVAGPLLAATPLTNVALPGLSAAGLRSDLLDGRPHVDLGDLLLVAWSAGIPTVHLRFYPLPQKRMAAMTVAHGGRAAVLIGKNSRFPAQIAFYLAHELGHVALGHLADDRLIVDFEDLELSLDGTDPEERTADAFALELLTGQSRPIVTAAGRIHPTARSLAEASVSAGAGLRIEPGVVALCYGYSSQEWAVVTKALGFIYPRAEPVWRGVNDIARSQLEFAALPADAADYLDEVLGPTTPE